MKRDDVTVDVVADTAQFDQAMRSLTESTRHFARVFTSALSGSVKSGKNLDDTLRGIALRLSDLALKSALKPLDNLLGDIGDAWLGRAASGVAGIGSAGGLHAGNITPFARGGVINGPTFFNFGTRTGVMGEQGPEAIMPLSRGSDGRLGVAAAGDQGNGIHVVFNVQATDAASFRKSKAQISAMLARVVNRGQRGI